MRDLSFIVILVYFSGDALGSKAAISIGLVTERNIFVQHERYVAISEYVMAKTGIGI